MVLMNTSVSSGPAINLNETEAATRDLAAVIARVGGDSVAGLILRQAHNELLSVIRSARLTPAAVDVVGPFRVPVAA